jgi:circadian clock protein KaiC
MNGTRVPTGIPGLDVVLGGGLLPGALLFIVGMPGAGKTLLAQQMAFASARRGVPAVCFTTLSEPHDKLLRHIGDLSFYDPALLGEGVLLLNLEQALRQGAEETTDAIVQTVRGQGAGLVVLDALRGAADLLGGSGTRTRELLYQLSARLGLLGVCCVVTFETDAFTTDAMLEFVSADVVIALKTTPEKAVRTLHVLKARGCAPLAGDHSLYIERDGITVYPQAESLPVRPAAGISQQRAAFGLPALDALLQGGPNAGTSMVIAGAPGTGKTLLALDWLQAGAAAGERGLLLGFHESAAQLLDRADSFGLPLRRYVEQGSIELITRPPVALDGNVIAAELRARIAANGVRRLAVDSARELEASVPAERATSYLAALVAYLRGEAVSALVTYEVSNKVGIDFDFSGTSAAVLAEDKLFLRHSVDRRSSPRALAVLKMRYSSFDPALHSYAITSAGFSVGPPFDAAPPVANDAEER